MERNEKMSKEDKRRIIITSSILGVFIILCVVLIIVFWDYIYGLFTRDEKVINDIENMLTKYGSWAWLILLFFMILQVVFAVLPNGPFEMIAGIMYGPFKGILIALAGATLGALIVILLVKAFGKGFAGLFVNLKDGQKYKLLNDEKRCLVVMFGLLIIPGIPKDFLAFLVPFTKIKTWKFLIINLIARTPVTIFSVLFGDSIRSGNYALSISLGIVALIIGLICVIFNKKIVSLFSSKIKEESKNEN